MSDEGLAAEVEKIRRLYEEACEENLRLRQENERLRGRLEAFDGLPERPGHGSPA